MVKEDATKQKRIIIQVDKELFEILKSIETKIKETTWGGVENISNKDLTRVLARKIKASKIL